MRKLLKNAMGLLVCLLLALSLLSTFGCRDRVVPRRCQVAPPHLNPACITVGYHGTLAQGIRR